MNISERMIYMARKVCRLAPHLEEQIMAGKLSINEAYPPATNKPAPERPHRAENAAGPLPDGRALGEDRGQSQPTA